MSASCLLCFSGRLRTAFRYDAPPAGETAFDLRGRKYERTISCCPVCGHFTSRHELDLKSLYSGPYMDATYGSRIEETYDRIMGLSPDRSDNYRRVQRVLRAMSEVTDRSSRSLLDVGSGLGVFPARMKEAGWDVTALDPDPRAAAHLRDRVGVDVVVSDFLEVEPSEKFQLVTFNKVLEHVSDPVRLLGHAARFLHPGGVVYVELPDGELAASKGPSREEFFIEHIHVFSMASLCLLAVRSNFSVRFAERFREPSDKLTLAAFLEPSTNEG